VFLDNLVHGDLHPGNILVKPDHSGLVVLDPGIVARLSQRDMANFKAVFAAVVTGDATKVSKHLTT
jgi:predicted unusual protein kinase regulating ubiquinone biosynthesis (AarF/ABC1/UbiB family)